MKPKINNNYYLFYNLKLFAFGCKSLCTFKFGIVVIIIIINLLLLIIILCCCCCFILDWSDYIYSLYYNKYFISHCSTGCKVKQIKITTTTTTTTRKKKQ